MGRMALVTNHDASVRPRATGLLPGRLLAKQDRCQPDARVYPRHISIAVDEVSGRFHPRSPQERFHRLLGGSRVRSLGHNQLELVRVAAGRLGRFARGQDLLHQAATSHDDVR
jgi:diaminobutyrate-2-oxoglutarate transaminase